jgi:xanthine dehydrogenase YagR molybdenum-binding subunit
MATASVVPAVLTAADSASSSLLTIVVTTPKSPFENRKPDDLLLQDGRVFLKLDGPANGVGFQDLLRAPILASSLAMAHPKRPSVIRSRSLDQSFGCDFVEVTAQPEIARLRVSRVVTVMDAGRIVNPLAGRNQIIGRSCDGNRNGVVRAHILRSAERRANQQ